MGVAVWPTVVAFVNRRFGNRIRDEKRLRRFRQGVNYRRRRNAFVPGSPEADAIFRFRREHGIVPSPLERGLTPVELSRTPLSLSTEHSRTLTPIVHWSLDNYIVAASGSGTENSSSVNNISEFNSTGSF